MRVSGSGVNCRSLSYTPPWIAKPRRRSAMPRRPSSVRASMRRSVL